jgi:hypothetical protein
MVLSLHPASPIIVDQIGFKKSVDRASDCMGKRCAISLMEIVTVVEPALIILIAADIPFLL